MRQLRQRLDVFDDGAVCRRAVNGYQNRLIHFQLSPGSSLSRPAARARQI
jgi:hypothetical protein